MLCPINVPPRIGLCFLPYLNFELKKEINFQYFRVDLAITIGFNFHQKINQVPLLLKFKTINNE